MDIANRPLCQGTGRWFITLFVFWDPARSEWREEISKGRLGRAWDISQQFREEPRTKQDSRHPGMTNTNEGNLAQFIHFFFHKITWGGFGFCSWVDFQTDSPYVIPLITIPCASVKHYTKCSADFPRVWLHSATALWRSKRNVLETRVLCISLSLQQFMNSKHSGFYKDRYGIVSIAFE